MSLFKKKTTLVHHITYMGIMACINVLFVILETYEIAIGAFLLILLLPFISTIVSYYCLKRYYIIYAFATFGLCAIFNVSSAIFYIIPALTSGFVVGALLERKVNPFWIILLCTFIEVGFTYAFIPLIKLISGSETSYIDALIEFIGLGSFTYRDEVSNLIIFFIALIQCSLAQFVLLNEIHKLGIEINTGVASFAPYISGLLASLIIALVLAIVYQPLAFVFVAVSLYFATFLLADIIMSQKLAIYLILGGLFIVSFFAFAILYTKIDKPLGMILVIFFPLSVAITSFINNYLIKKK